MTAQGIAIDVASLKNSWTTQIAQILHEATLDMPTTTFMHTGGKEGVHTEHLGQILTELQYMQRAYPNMEW
jgi:ring-1,2-phenylacetyl-CoA epoxidase subunit PaaC